MTAQVAQTARIVMPGSRAAYDYEVVRAANGILRFKSARTIGIYNPKTGNCYYSSRGNSNLHLRHQARPVKIGKEIVDALNRVAVLSPNALRKLSS